MAQTAMDLSAGMVAKKPMHPSGEVTGWSQDDGLPIVKRKTVSQPLAEKKEPSNSPEKPAAKPEAKEEKPEPKQDDAPAKPAALAKGSAVQMPDGSTGKISYLHTGMNIAAVTKDGGGRSTHPLSKLKAADSPEAKETDVPAGHTFVSAHYRPLPDKPN